MQILICHAFPECYTIFASTSRVKTCFQVSNQKIFKQLIRKSDRFPRARHVNINDTLLSILVSPLHCFLGDFRKRKNISLLINWVLIIPSSHWWQSLITDLFISLLQKLFQPVNVILLMPSAYFLAFLLSSIRVKWDYNRFLLSTYIIFFIYKIFNRNKLYAWNKRFLLIMCNYNFCNKENLIYLLTPFQ